MDDLQTDQQNQKSAGLGPEIVDQDTLRARQAAAQQQAAGDPNTANPANTAAPTSADVAKNADAIKEHIYDAQDDFVDVEKAVAASPAADHEGVKAALAKFKNRLEHLFKHAEHNAKVASAVPAPVAAAEAPAKTVSTATSDAHLNRGNGGAVTGNPGASFSQASAAQMAVEQGAEIPGVAKVPQPDVAVR